MGSAHKNKGVQSLDVLDYLPSPPEVDNFALTLEDEEQVKVDCDDDCRSSGSRSSSRKAATVS